MRASHGSRKPLIPDPRSLIPDRRALVLDARGGKTLYLVDANVLSELTKDAPHPRAVAWLREHEREITVDPIIVGEIRFGILLLPRGRRRQSLERWFNEGVQRLHCLSWNVATGLRWAALLARLRASGQAMTIKDSLIAATALEHGLTIATRNAADFRKAGVTIVNPFLSPEP